MQQEQRLILKMLEEGKITAEEAEALLNALTDGHSAEQGPQEDPWVRLEKLGEDFASKVEAATERFSRSLEHRTEGLSEKLIKLPKIFARFPFANYEQAHEFTQVLRGRMGVENGIGSIALDNFNGPLQVEGWAEEGWQLIVTQRLRGKDRDAVRGRLFSPEWADGEERSSFELSVPDREDRFVALHLMVPEKRDYRVRLTAFNGSLHLENLTATSAELGTTNGSVILNSVHGDSVRGKISNGSCEMDGVRAETIRFRIGNGSYRLRVSARDVDCVATNGSIDLRTEKISKNSNYALQTVNGSIEVKLPAQADLGTSFELSTSVGRIHADLGPLENIREKRGGGGAALSGRTLGFQEQPLNLSLAAASISGSISVSGCEEEEG